MLKHAWHLQETEHTFTFNEKRALQRSTDKQTQGPRDAILYKLYYSGDGLLLFWTMLCYFETDTMLKYP